MDGEIITSKKKNKINYLFFDNVLGLIYYKKTNLPFLYENFI